MKCHWVEPTLSSWREPMRPGQKVLHKWRHWEREERQAERRPAVTTSPSLSDYIFPHTLPPCKLNVPVQAVELCRAAEVLTPRILRLGI